MRYRIEIQQGGKCIWSGQWFETQDDYDFAEKMIREALDCSFGKASSYVSRWKNNNGDWSFIPQNILVNSIIVISNEENVNDSTEEC